MFPSFRVLFFISALVLVSGEASPKSPAIPAGVSTASPVIVIGFVGGYVRHDDRVHMEVQLVERLREEYASNAFVQTFENHRGKDAHQAVLRLLDANSDGKLSSEEKQNARIIIFGHSWGASETVELARQLEKDGIPVVLTIQVDSVSKRGEDDAVIPANVVSGRQLLSARWNAARTSSDSRRQSRAHAHPREFPFRLQSETSQLWPISLVGPPIHEAPHSN